VAGQRPAQAGPSGAKELTTLLNGCFGQLIDLIAARGGDVVKFSGDALLHRKAVSFVDAPAA